MVVGTKGTPRYAPWLQKALRIRDDTERFWIVESQRHAPAGQAGHPTLKASNQPVEEPQDTPPKSYESVWDAVGNNDAAAVQTYLTASPSIVFQRRDDKNGGGGTTLFHEAAFEGATEVLRALIGHTQSHYGHDTTRMLVNVTDTVYSQVTPLICACLGAKGHVNHRLAVVKLLVQAGADVELQDAHGDNSVHWCARTSNNVLLRWLLKATDAGANAVVAENAKREKPLDIAKRKLAGTKTQAFAAHSVLDSLRSVDRKCNVRLTMQVIKHHSAHLQNETTATLEAEWSSALAIADDTVNHGEGVWAQAVKQAEVHRTEAETVFVATAGHTAQASAEQWMETKDGKNYLKQQQVIATEELKVEILKGSISKPKDMKKAAIQRATDTYIRHQEDTVREKSLDEFHSKRPTYPSDPQQLQTILERKR